MAATRLETIGRRSAGKREEEMGETHKRMENEELREVLSRYGDIIDKERPASTRHAPMSREARAAQFAPFAALTGYDHVVKEQARRHREDLATAEEGETFEDAP